MKPFLSEISDLILKKNTPLADSIWVFPSKRAGVFAKDYLRSQISNTQFAPEFYSIESFITELSQTQLAATETALCLLYECYLALDLKEKDSFASFSPWGTTLLQDFNEIDRYGVAAEKLYTHIQNLQEVSHWALEADKTDMVQNYLKFWEQLPVLYKTFTAKMEENALGHQGLLYKKAFENLPVYLETHPNKTLYFIGFNALNTSESQIIQAVLKEKRGEVYWDIDQFFLNNKVHEAGYFIRKHQKNWPYFEKQTLEGTSAFYSKNKNIALHGVPKSVSQAHLIAKILGELSEGVLKNTAIVLGDEQLLNPLLHSLPPELNANITMGYPLADKPMAALVQAYFELHNSGETNGWYVGHLRTLLLHPYVALLIDSLEPQGCKRLLHHCDKKNTTYITEAQISALLPKAKELIGLFFGALEDKPLLFIAALLKIMSQIKEQALRLKKNELVSETLYFLDLLESLEPALVKFYFIDSLKSFWKLYLEKLSKQKLSFSGEALSGLQIMGMLESRNLDFETLIISHVNEGILPGGKSNNSFIPLSLKKIFRLPTFKEKDAVYAYHFYRLLQRAKKVFLLYNTATDVLEGGEPSRFIYQLKTQQLPGVVVQENIAMPLLSNVSKKLTQIQKSQHIVMALEEKAASGFSPSAVNTYVRNPIDFYKRYVLKLKEPEVLEEIIAYNTFGSIVHDSLEVLYKDCIGVPLENQHFKAIEGQIEGVLKTQYERLHSPLEGARGKNIIAYRVILKYLEDFVRQDQAAAAKESLTILSLEEEFSMSLDIPGLSAPLQFKGKIDRVEKRNGHIQVIDFKTGMVKAAALKLKNWGDLATEPNASKTLQLLAYAMLYQEKYPETPIKAGIYSFKNTAPGIMYFENGTASSDRQTITTETIGEFKNALVGIVQEIFNTEVPFIEKEV